MYNSHIKNENIIMLKLLSSVSNFIKINTTIGIILLAVNAAKAENLVPYSSTLEFSFRKGVKRNLGEIDYMLPFYEKKDNLLILDLKTKIDNSKSKELNLGLVYRYIYNDKAIFGIYNYFDYRKTGNNFNVKGWTGGVEVLSEYLDGRVNFYLPQNKTKKVKQGTKKTVRIQGTSIFGISEGNTYERALRGYDVEIGCPLFGFSEKFNNILGTRVFVSKYDFRNKDTDKVAGTRFRLEQKLGHIDVGKHGLYFSLNAATQYDKIRKRQNSIGLSAKLIFNNDKKQSNSLRSRMMDTVIRDIDIVTTAKKNPDSSHNFIMNGKEIKNIYFVGNADSSYQGDGTKDNPFSIEQFNKLDTSHAIIVTSNIDTKKGGKILSSEQYENLKNNPQVIIAKKEMILSTGEENPIKIVINSHNGVHITTDANILSENIISNSESAQKSIQLTSAPIVEANATMLEQISKENIQQNTEITQENGKNVKYVLYDGARVRIEEQISSEVIASQPVQVVENNPEHEESEVRVVENNPAQQEAVGEREEIAIQQALIEGHQSEQGSEDQRRITEDTQEQLESNDDRQEVDLSLENLSNDSEEQSQHGSDPQPEEEEGNNQQNQRQEMEVSFTSQSLVEREAENQQEDYGNLVNEERVQQQEGVEDLDLNDLFRLEDDSQSLGEVQEQNNENNQLLHEVQSQQEEQNNQQAQQLQQGDIGQQDANIQLPAEMTQPQVVEQHLQQQIEQETDVDLSNLFAEPKNQDNLVQQQEDVIGFDSGVDVNSLSDLDKEIYNLILEIGNNINVGNDPNNKYYKQQKYYEVAKKIHENIVKNQGVDKCKAILASEHIMSFMHLGTEDMDLNNLKNKWKTWLATNPTYITDNTYNTNDNDVAKYLVYVHTAYKNGESLMQETNDLYNIVNNAENVGAVSGSSLRDRTIALSLSKLEEEYGVVDGDKALEVVKKIIKNKLKEWGEKVDNENLVQSNAKNYINHKYYRAYRSVIRAENEPDFYVDKVYGKIDYRTTISNS